jgi:hypothetical protein
MISTIADLLLEIEKNGIEQIKPFLKVKHPTMIGDMYEGLTKEILNRSIFHQLDIKVVSGKISNKDNRLSGQIDCMIVVGEGQQFPYSKDYIYESEQVIAVIEVKKNLFNKDLVDAFNNLKTVYEVCDPVEFEINILRDAYRSIVNEEVPDYDELDKLPFHTQMVYHSLLIEAAMPVRIVFGYDGFKSEYSLRNAFMKFLYSQYDPINLPRGFGPNNFPQLIICNNNSLIKTNGMPYSAPLIGEKWLVYSSYNKNPLLLLLELLWTKLSYKFGITSDIFGEDLSSELLRPLVFGKCIKKDGRMGWEYYENKIPRKDFEYFPDTLEWQPSFLNNAQFHIVNGLCNLLPANLNDTEFIEFVINLGNYQSKEEFVKDMLDTNLIYISENQELKLITDECKIYILPDGRVVAGEDKTGRLTRWLNNYNNKRNETEN